jgi:hypothetical protein
VTLGSAIIPAPTVLHRHTPVSCQSPGPGGRPDRDLCLRAVSAPAGPRFALKRWGARLVRPVALPPSPPQARREPPAPPRQDRRLRAKTWRSPLAHSRWRARSFDPRARLFRVPPAPIERAIAVRGKSPSRAASLRPSSLGPIWSDRNGAPNVCNFALIGWLESTLTGHWGS